MAADSHTDAGASDRAGAVLEIDLAAIGRNWRSLRDRLAGGALCTGVVKADAYGLGMSQVAPALAASGCRLFFVAHLDEGIALRALLPECEIAVLNGLLPGTHGDFAAHRLMPVLNDLGQVASWKQQAAEGRRQAILHVDTGMARLGLPPDELARLAAAPDLLDGIELRAVMSHLACPEEPEHWLNAQQLAALPRRDGGAAARAGESCRLVGDFSRGRLSFRDRTAGRCRLRCEPTARQAQPDGASH